MGDTLELIIRPGGRAEFIHDDRLAALFADRPSTTRRASHVEPVPGGGWDADMTPVGGPDHLGPFKTKQEALDAEVLWLREHMAVAPLEVRC